MANPKKKAKSAPGQHTARLVDTKRLADTKPQAESAAFENDLDSHADSSVRSHSLAPVQRRTLEYLRTFMSDNGFAPTLKDIAQSIGVRSPSTAHFHLSRLEDKGFIRRSDDGAFELVEREEVTASSSPCAVPLLGLIAAGSPIESNRGSLRHGGYSTTIPRQQRGNILFTSDGRLHDRCTYHGWRCHYCSPARYR